MERKRLGDIATYINGYPFKPEDRGDEGLPIIRIQDLTGNVYDLGFYNGSYPARIEINDGDVLISWSASLGVYVWDRGKALLNQHIFKVAFDKEAVNKQYFVFAVQHKLIEMESKTHGATMKHIVKKDFDNTEIPFPSLERQAEIADILSRIKLIIDARQQQLAALDDLIKTRFVEMFGDPIINDRGWQQITLLESLEAGRTVTYGIVQTGDEYENGTPVFRPIDIAGGHVPKREELKKTDPLISEQYKRTLLKGNELLITVRGSVGETFQTTEEFEGCNVGRNIVPLVTDSSKVLQRFLKELFAQNAIKNWLKGITKGIALQGLNMGEFKEMPVIMPPIAKQKEYVNFALQIDKSKAVVQKALDEAQLLFDSLMQKYFN